MKTYKVYYFYPAEIPEHGIDDSYVRWLFILDKGAVWEVEIWPIASCRIRKIRKFKKEVAHTILTRMANRDGIWELGHYYALQ